MNPYQRRSAKGNFGSMKRVVFSLLAPLAQDYCHRIRGVLKLLEAADLPAKDAHGPDAWRQLSNFLGGAPRAGRSVVKLTHHG